MSDAPERWAEVAGYPGYRVSTLGRVQSSRKRGPGDVLSDRLRLIKPRPTPSGHLIIDLHRGDAAVGVAVHRLVLIAFVGTPEEGQCARHLNGVKTDNRLDNLRWGTGKEVAADAMFRRAEKGTRPSNAKLTNELVRAIKLSAQTMGKGRGTTLAKQYGISKSLVSQILSGKRWRHITTESNLGK